MNTLILQNNPKELARLSQWVESFTQQHNIAKEVSFKMELAVVEAVSNIIDYAYEGEQSAVSVSSVIVDNTIVIELKDSGRPFNPLALPGMEFADSLDDAKIGGWGIHLIKNYTDDCFYFREDKTNRLKMIITL